MISIAIRSLSMETITIGTSKVSKLGIGTWAWGDKFYWKYKPSQDEKLQEAFNYCVNDGINLFDTAEVYGFGRSELLCGRFRRQLQNESLRESLVLATKFAPLPFRLGPQSVLSACQYSLDRLGVDKMALYQLHWPGLFGSDAYLEGIAMCYEKGLIGAVGVSNFGPAQLRAAHKFLLERGVPLSSNQIQLSLLSRQAEVDGLLQVAAELGVTVLAYSPLAQGLLTGKFDTSALPVGPRQVIVRSTSPKIEGLLRTMKEIAAAKASERTVSLSQVAINWCIAKGAVPIPGVRSLAQAEDNCAALKWSLEEAEVAALDEQARLSGVSIPTPLQGR